MVLKKLNQIAILKWKGSIDDRICIGCEIDTESKYTFDGHICGKQLFSCDNTKKSLILIAVKDSNEETDHICERVDDAKHNKISKTTKNVIKEECICCIEDMAKTNRYKDKFIQVNDNVSGNCKWFGLVNGVECIGVQVNKTGIAQYKYDGIIKRMNLFNVDYSKTALFLVTDIVTTIQCDKNKINIINHTNIQRLDEGESFNKEIIVKQGTYSKIVTIKWKGKVDGNRCLGCELSEDSKYGTDGTFNDQSIFKCEDKRGVLILLDESIQCCLTETNKHNAIKANVLARPFIDNNCICCAEGKENIGTNDKIIISSEHSGIIKWKGAINGVECYGVDLDKYVSHCTDGTFNEFKLFKSKNKNGILVKVEDIADTIKCDQINIDVYNPTKMRKPTDLQEISKYLVLTKGKEVYTIDAVCCGLINDKKVIGCILPFNYVHGTDGTFNGEQVFTCGNKNGVLIAEESFDYRCCSDRHRELKYLESKLIHQHFICCMQSDNLNDEVINKPIVINQENKKYICKSLWTGQVNGSKAIGIEMDNKMVQGTDGKFHGKKLFDCKPESGYLYDMYNEQYSSELDFVRDIYLENNIEINIHKYQTNPDKIGSLVCVKDNPPIYGRVVFCMSLFDESLIGMNINSEYLKEVNKANNNVIFPGSNKSDQCLIIVRSNYVEEFSDKLLYSNDSNIIDMSSVKIIENCDEDRLKIDDIVGYDNCYGKIVDLKLLNNILCVGLKNTINVDGDNELRYVREDKVKKFDVFWTKALELTIIEPLSIATFRITDYTGFKLGDEVEFNLFKLNKKFNGKILLILEINNDTPSAIIELKSYQNFDLTKYRINEIQTFKDLIGRKTENVVIVLLNTLHRIETKIFKCLNNNVTILDPGSIRTINKARKEDKFIIFKVNGPVTVFARLKWIGEVNDDRYIGCEMINMSQCGTNGRFGNNKLFECADDRGVLIPMNTIHDTCVYVNHRIIENELDRRIKGSSICCAQTINVLKNIPDLKLGCRVMHLNDKESIFGICQWIGLVNNVEVIAVDLGVCSKVVKDNWMEKIAIFVPILLDPNVALFLAVHFELDNVGLCYCSKNNLIIINKQFITSCGTGKKLEKKMRNQMNNVTSILNIKWRGDINGELSFGCVMSNKSDYGTTGIFGSQQLFECEDGKGVLIPVKCMIGSCEFGQHQNIKVDNGSIEASSICCVESLGRINIWSKMTIGSKVIVKKGWIKYLNTTGECQWIGLVNGVESVGLNMVKKGDYHDGTNGTFCFAKLFTCTEGHGKLFKAEDIEHDIRGESLSFVFDKIVDITIIWKINETGDVDGWNIGDYVSTDIYDRRIQKLSWNGELKWIGVINKVKCVGIDLEDQCQYGMDGVIQPFFKFGCKEEHGIVTTMDNIKLKTEYPTLNNNGFIDANKFVRFEKKWNKEFMEERKVTKDGEVFVIMDNYGDGKWKRSGILRLCGTMNGVSVAVVELNDYCEYGSNGIFWRQQLIQCRDKRAVAVPLENIYEYIHYQRVIIPKIDQRFKEININSAVIYYSAKYGDKVEKNYGTVRWIGREDYDKYVYGIELDDKFLGASDGTFKGERLFHCRDGHGVVAYLDAVAPDLRFIEQVYRDDDVSKTKACTEHQLSILAKRKRGEYVGIQGNANSCYFDSLIFALFSKSDVLDHIINEKLNLFEINEITKKFRNVISWKIVYPLRESGFVSFHNTQELCDIILGYGEKFFEMTKKESDMENVGALLAKLCEKEQLLSLRPFQGVVNNGMFLQVFVILQKRLKNITSQTMLEISMAQNNIMFDKPPTCLIIQAPRDARGINCYENVLPSKNIEISNICYNRYKTCAKCNDMATYQCKLCIEESLTVKEGQFCNKHKCRHDEIVKMPLSNVKSRSEVHMQLKAIICIEKAHFVAYVKEDEFDENWIFFDSMSTQNSENNYAIPKVSDEENVTKFLNSSTDEMELQLETYYDNSLKRIIKDSYIFIYHNTTQTCY